MSCIPIIQRGKVVGSVSIGGPTLFIRSGRQVVHFEDHSYCGPMPTTKDGNGRNLQPYHWFWSAVTRWYELGKKLKGNEAVWTEQP